MAKYLVTGGCGFIGSHLVEALRKRGHAIRLLDDLSSGRRENLSVDVEFLPGSITQKKDVERALDGIEGCFHLAAVGSVEQSIREWSTSHQTNLFGTILLLEEIVQQNRKIPFIYASSAAVYGNPSRVPINELSQPAPLSPYGIDKLACEHHAKVAWELHGIPTVGMRFFNVYGLRQHPKSPYSGIISILLDRIPKHETITIFGDGEQQRDFIHVEDIVASLLKVMERVSEGGKVFNVCTGKGTRVNRLVELIESLYSTRAHFRYSPMRQGDIKDSIGDPTALKNDFGMQATLSIEEGLAKLVEQKARVAP